MRVPKAFYDHLVVFGVYHATSRPEITHLVRPLGVKHTGLQAPHTTWGKITGCRAIDGVGEVGMVVDAEGE